MAHFVMADDGIPFDGTSLESGPLGGAETAFVSLAEALARRGHDVDIRNNCATPHEHNGVRWKPLAGGLPDSADLYIANRGDKLIGMMPAARRRVFWIHNPAGYLVKWRYLWKLWRGRVPIVFSGKCHAGTYPRWAPAGERIVIPYGMFEPFRTTLPAAAPPRPRAVFTSNPLRSLDWLLGIWHRRIRPRVAGAELMVYSGASTYGGAAAPKSAEMDEVLRRAAAMTGDGVVLHAPLPKADLARVLAGMRVLLYRGDPGESFCLAVAEAQAMGVPCVVQDIGCVGERLIDGETGFIARNDAAFADAAVRLLTDDVLWRAQHAAALDNQRGWGWDDAAAGFEALLP